MKLDSQTVPISDKLRAYSLATNELHDRVIVVTGATGGLGTALSKACAAAGASVVLIGKNTKKLDALYDVLDELGPAQPAIVPINQDIAGEPEYLQLAQMLETEFGHIDALVHTAAEIGKLTPFAAVTQADWMRVMAVNLNSARLLSSACMPLLSKTQKSSMLFTVDHKPGAYWGAYGVSKIALHTLAMMLADETNNQCNNAGEPKLAVNAIDPGPMRTQLRRRAFPGELESETPLPNDCLGPFLYLINRTDPAITGITYSANCQ